MLDSHKGWLYNLYMMTVTQTAATERNANPANAKEGTMLTVSSFVSRGSDRPVFLRTFAGTFRVSQILWPDTNPTAVCPDANAGFGSQFAVGPETLLHLDSTNFVQTAAGGWRQV